MGRGRGRAGEWCEWSGGIEAHAWRPYPLADDGEWVRRGYAPVPTPVGGIGKGTGKEDLGWLGWVRWAGPGGLGPGGLLCLSLSLSFVFSNSFLFLLNFMFSKTSQNQNSFINYKTYT